MWNEIKSEKDLPPEGKYVFGKHNRGTWHDDRDQKNVNTVVIILVKGISEKERKEMPECKRKNVWKFGDEEGNNTVPYEWDTFGLDSFFGESITHWMEIPDVKPI